IFQIDQTTVRILQDDAGELIGVFQSAERGDNVLGNLSSGRRRLTDLAGWYLNILWLDKVGHILSVEILRRHLLWSEPQSHAVVALAQVSDVADARQTRKFVADLDGSVVAQFEIRATLVLGKKVDDQKNVWRFLFDGNATTFDQVRQDRFSERFTILH